MEEQKKVSIEMADMVGKTYFKVATWFNQDFDDGKERQDALKHVCAEIVQHILEDTFLQIDGINSTETKTVKNESAPQSPTNHQVGNIFNITEDTFTRALRGNQ